jgi:L-fuconolactonase
LNSKEGWPGLTTEEIIEPELPICDPHHHLWDTPGRQYLLDELFQDIGGGHNIVQTVFIESASARQYDEPQIMQPVNETEFTHEITASKSSSKYGKTKVAAGIVGFADFTLGSGVVPVLEAHLAASDRFRGIRQICSWDANSDIIHSTAAPGLLMDTGFREGAACLQKYGLSFETFIYHPQLTELVDMARALPDITIILDHIGGPLGIGPYADKRDEIFLEWKKAMADLSACPNVFIKLGGLGMPICGFGWSERDVHPNSTEIATETAPYYLWCIEKFGVGRCMFESNFPVDKASYSYDIMWNAFKRISKDFSPEERAALFYDTAVKAYRL